MIRKFKKEDLPQILELCRMVRQHHIDMLNGYFMPQNDEEEKLDFIESLQNDKVVALVSTDNNHINGYLLAKFKNLPHLVNSRVANIENFGVDTNERRKGIGKQLMDAFFELCRQNNISEIRLKVFNQNTAARKFYEKYGFKSTEQKMTFNLDK